jgi:DNA-binding NtrC family response regulator
LSNSLSIKKRILCLEEQQNSCEFLTYLLAEYEIIFAIKKEIALTLINSEDFALCLLDCWAIEDEGIALCQQIKTLNPTLPIIYTSNISQSKEIQKILNSGVENYLMKPYAIENLQQIIKELIERENN